MIKVQLTANLQKYYPTAKFEVAATNVLDLLKQGHVNKIAFGVSPVPPLVPVGTPPAPAPPK